MFKLFHIIFKVRVISKTKASAKNVSQLRLVLLVHKSGFI